MRILMTDVAISEFLTGILEPPSVRSSQPRALKKRSDRIPRSLSKGKLERDSIPKSSILFRGSRPTWGERRGGLCRSAVLFLALLRFAAGERHRPCGSSGLIGLPAAAVFVCGPIH